MMRTPLYEEHLRLKAVMTEFAGWDMPVYYSGIVNEVNAVRKAAGIFDLSHMGEFLVSGSKGQWLLQSLLTNAIPAIGTGQAQYNLMCDENGGVIDDLIVYRPDEDSYMVVVNASNIDKDFAWISQHNDMRAHLVNRSEETALVAVQGPASKALLQPLTGIDIQSMKRFRVQRGLIRQIEVIIASTGYTGSPGFEIFCAAGDAQALWNAILEAGEPFGAIPCGLGARDVLRTEACYPLYGNELSASITPVEAGLMWAVKLDKGDFMGRKAIMEVQERGINVKLVGIQAVERCIPRHGYDVLAGDRKVGTVTSGTFSPTLGKGIAMAYVELPYTDLGTNLDISIRGKACPFTVAKMPFYKAS